MLALNRITDRQLTNLLAGRFPKKLMVLDQVVKKYKNKEYWKDGNLALYHGIIFLHTNNIITLSSKQLQRVMDLEKEEKKC